MPDFRTDDARTPVEINIAVGAGFVVAAGLVAAVLPMSEPVLRWGVLVVAVAGFAALTYDQIASGATAGIGYLIFVGFLVNRHGELTWHGMSDVWRLMALVMAVTAGLTIGELYRIARRARHWRAVSSALLDQRETSRLSETENRDG